MAYLEEFASSISARDYTKVVELWQEYCGGENPDSHEISQILLMIKESDAHRKFGIIISEILPLIQSITDENEKLPCFALLFDIQTTHSQELWDLAQAIIQYHFPSASHLQEKLRLVGLRSKENFQGAITNFILLNHIRKGAFVLHNAGWGVGEIIDYSFLREQLTVEFENLGGTKKDIPFKNAYKSLKPLADDHFFSLRYAHPEVLGEMALKDPSSLLVKIISDVGPKNSQGIKELLIDTIIDESSYSKWWQGIKSRLKRDGKIALPENSPKENFTIQTHPLSSEQKITNSLKNKSSIPEIIYTLYSLIKDFPQLLKENGSQKRLFEIIEAFLSTDTTQPIHTILSYFLLENIDLNSSKKYLPLFHSALSQINEYQKALQSIEIAAFKKRFLIAIQGFKENWETLFTELFLQVDSSQLREFISKELLSSTSGKTLLFDCLENLFQDPTRYPETFFWYFQKSIEAVQKGEIGEFLQNYKTLFSPQKIFERFFETFLFLYSSIEFRSEMKELVKKMYNIMTQTRFQLVRSLLKETDLSYAKEFLLLTSKCRSLSDHDQKILRSLVQVVHPSLHQSQKNEIRDEAASIIWTTEESYHKLKEKIHHIGTVEVVDNAKEIEEARKLGDLRENSEYKFALERRARLQKDLQSLSDQFQAARILTPDDVSVEMVGIGTKVALQDQTGTYMTSYTILGPWDADTETNVIAIESKIAQSMLGKTRNAYVDIKGQRMKIESITSIFE